jgi:hypothetical protein
MNSKPSDPIDALRDTITAIDREPGSPPPALKALRQLLEDRLHRLEAKSQMSFTDPGGTNPSEK